jgi:hypothetical protein
MVSARCCEITRDDMQAGIVADGLGFDQNPHKQEESVLPRCCRCFATCEMACVP